MLVKSTPVISIVNNNNVCLYLYQLLPPSYLIGQIRTKLVVLETTLSFGDDRENKVKE